jgi:ferredoxin
MPGPDPAGTPRPRRRWIQAAFLGLYLLLFFYVAWPYGTDFSHRLLPAKEWVPLESFLWADPLVGFSTALAARHWNGALLGALAVLGVCLVLPRAFCGHVCPLGTLQDLFHWALGKRLRRWCLKRIDGLRYVRFYLLAAVLLAASLGVVLSGYLAAIPVLTRGLLFSVGRLQLGLLKHWGMAGPTSAALWCSLGLFGLVFLLGLLGQRFWCRCVCPSGALLSLAGWLGPNRRQVKTTCTGCGHCVDLCPFDAIQEDHRARPLDCGFCQTCVDNCPSRAISFAPRWRAQAGGREVLEAACQPPMSRRAMVASLLGGAAAVLTVRASGTPSKPLLRPPGSVPEARFLDLCIRCGECLKVCPGSVLQPAGFEAGLDALWTPVLLPTHAGCHQNCNFCTQVCPTGAIRPLTIQEKKTIHIGRAVIDPEQCLPRRGQRDCQLCYDECRAAGYHAIEMRHIPLPTGDVPAGALAPSEEEEMASIRAPFVNSVACVGCGLCEFRCHAVLHRQQKVLPSSAIVVEARDEDRFD